MKKIYLDIAGRMHSLYKQLVDYPPEGYQFVAHSTTWDKAFSAATRLNAIYTFQKRALSKVIPVNLAKAYLEKFKKPPEGTVLTYSTGHLVFRKEPWVVDLERVTQLTGYNFEHFRRYKGLVERILGADHCKKIICWTEAAKKTVLGNLDCSGFEEKIELVPLAVPKKNFFKQYNEDKVRLLFVCSATIPGQFDLKGGKEVLEAFDHLSRKYDNLELVIRSDVPQEVKSKYRRLSSIKIIEEVIPWELLEKQFQAADVFIFPTHATSWMVVLDAMSYELPVITVDVWGNREFVEDGKTGFVVKKSERIEYYIGNFEPAWSTPQFMKAIKKTVDPRVVEELVEKASILIENKELRRRMGRAGRQEIEHGKFSLHKRNERLRRIFDEATASSKETY
jgi:glycosyltransferase involved in cell wall biosynthesis